MLKNRNRPLENRPFRPPGRGARAAGGSTAEKAKRRAASGLAPRYAVAEQRYPAIQDAGWSARAAFLRVEYKYRAARIMILIIPAAAAMA